MSATPRHVASPFAVRGVVESFYGPPYTWPRRRDLIRFLGQQGYNLYVYAPKWDRLAGTRWWEPYPSETMKEFATAVATAGEAGVDFCYAISPSGSVRYSDERDLARLEAKLSVFSVLGVRSFGLFFDDPPDARLRDAGDLARYRSYAAAHVDFANRLFAKLRALEPPCRLSVTPTDYHGRAPFGEYVYELGRGLHPDIELFYTGPEICSPTITAQDAADFAGATGRKPLIWDNYPVNDLAMEPELHLGPIRGRDPALHEQVRGVVVNPGALGEASKIALATFADYFADPAAYEPEGSWRRAVRLVAGENAGAVMVIARHTQYSCLGAIDPPRLKSIARAARATIRRGERLSQMVAGRALEAYLAELDDACDEIVTRSVNFALHADVLPWVECLAWWIKAARIAGELVDRAAVGEPTEEKRGGLMATMRIIAANGRRTAGELLRPVIEAALTGAGPRYGAWA